MPHVVTQSCVGDGSCVFACPVNCIQPTPDDPAFELAEMLHVDPSTCVDCGACVTACPVDAIKPAWKLDETERAFAQVNADWHATLRAATPATDGRGGVDPATQHGGGFGAPAGGGAPFGGPRRRPLLAPVRPPLVVRDRGEALRVAIVGSGPAAMYAAEELLTIPGAIVDVYERSAQPDGLVRTGVAPDHRRTRRVNRQLARIRSHPGLRLHLGVEVGADVTHAALAAAHHAVIYAVGAAVDRRLEIPGGERVVPATEMVGWYLGYAAPAVDLSARRAVVIGNGNVALDIARVLVQDPAGLADSDIAPAALEALRSSAIEEVVVAARRGPAESAFTLPELIGLTGTVAVGVDGDVPAGDTPKLDLLRSLGGPVTSGRRVTLRYGAAPVAVTERGVEFAAGPPVETGLVVSAIGYRGVPVADLPYDPATGTVPNDRGRVEPGVYVTGWIKRGPSGFIGTNRACAQDTVAALVDDHNAGHLPRLARNVSSMPR